MGLFPKRHQEPESSACLAPSPSPQYSSSQSQPQIYPSQSPYYQGSPSSSGMPYAPPSSQEPYPSGQQYQPQQQYAPQQNPHRAPSPSPLPNPAYRALSPAAFPTPQPRILHLTREGFSQRKAHIYESDNRTPAYELKTSHSAEWSFSSSKPHLEVTSASTGHVVGTVRFSMMSRHIELNVHGRSITLNSAGWMTRGYSFPGSNVGTLKWEASRIMGGTYACTTERGEWLAKCDQSCMSMHGKGTIEIVNRDSPQELMDELVVTAVAMLENERRNASHSAAA